MAWIRRVIPDVSDRNQSRWPTDPVWRVVQSATFADAPAAARRLIRRKQRGGDVVVLDRVEFGCLVSRAANLHPNGGEWTLSRALGETLPALEAIEAKKTQAGQDFGELVRERRRQRGLPLPIAEKVLPFRSAARSEHVLPGDDTRAPGDGPEVTSDPLQARLARVVARIAEAWARLEAAEHVGSSHRVLDGLEEAYLAESAAAHAAVARLSTSERGVP